MLEIKTRCENDIVIIGIAGDIDLYSSPQVRKKIIELTAKKTPAILINLDKVTYMDSSGVATLVEGMQLINDYNGKLLIFNVHGAVHDVFELSRLDKVFKIFDNETDALKACHDNN